MKKLILLVFTLIVIIGCTNGVNQRIPLKENNKRLTITKDNIIVETCIGFNGFGRAFWDYEIILQNDSIGIKNVEDIISTIKEQ